MMGFQKGELLTSAPTDASGKTVNNFCGSEVNAIDIIQCDD